MPRADPFGWIGSTIEGRFEIEAVAGEGAFGVVYRGKHLGFAEPVAIKCLKVPNNLTDSEKEGFLAAFHEEARILLRLSRRSTSIVQPLDFGAAQSPRGAWTPFIVMEWLEGETLERAMERRSAAGAALPAVEAAVALLRPVARALATAHELGIAHRDVKPGNVFLAREEEKLTAKLLDFGIAKVVAESKSITQALTRSGGLQRAFTPQYGAPEQFSPRFGATGPWTDVFAMGLVLIELVTGKPALSGADAVQLFVSSCDEGTRPNLARLGIAADPAVERALARALEVDPARRYRTMGELWDALDPRSESAVTSAPVYSAVPPASPSRPSVPAEPAPSAVSSSASWSSLATAPEENRLCTIVFGDISGFTSLSESLAPEQVKEIVDGCFQALTARIERLGGWVDKFMGDGVMAIFGLPRADESDAERAVRAAFEMQAALAELSRRSRLLRRRPLLMRIGINTGRVFAGRVGGATRREFTVIGDAVNIAARLQQHAPEGGIVVGRDTQRLVSGVFELEPLPPIDAKGKKEPLAAFRVLGAARSRPQLQPTDFYGLETKLCGRGADLERLVEALETAAAEPHALLLTISGPPGVGCSRLLAELASVATRRTRTFVLAAHGSPLSVGTSYGLIGSLLRSGFSLDKDDAPEVVLEKIRDGVQRMLPGRVAADPEEERIALSGTIRIPTAGDLARLPEELATLVGASSETADHDSIAPDDRWSQAKNRAAAALGHLVAALAERATPVLLCDDAHWADDASLDLLDDLVLRVSHLPLLVVLAARPELFERRPQWGEGKTAHARLDVRPLARRHIEEMVRDRLRLVDELTPEALRLVVERAEGNPLILQETLHLLVDAGVLEHRTGAPWHLRTERLSALALPATIQGIIQARLDRLEPEAREVLACASVVGRTFWEGAVASMVSEWADASAQTAATLLPGAPSAEARTTAMLARLRERQLVRLRDRSAFPGEREMVFAESATQEVAYETLSQKVRRSLHLRVASWLGERTSGDAGAALLALHYDRGGDVPRAAHAYVRAAGLAATLGQNAEALLNYERARELYEASEGTGEESFVETGPFQAGGEELRVATWRDRTRLRLELGDVLRRLGRLDEAEQRYQEARGRVLRAEQRRDQKLAASEPLVWDARLDFRLALLARVRGATTEARRLVERAIALATEAGVEEETPAMWSVLAAILRRDGELDACRAAALRGLRVCRAARVRDARWSEAVSHLLGALGGVSYSLGKLTRAERFCRQATRAVNERMSPEVTAMALNTLAAILFAKRQWAEARTVFLRSLAIKERQGDLHELAIAYNNLAEVDLRLGEGRVAFTHARQSVRLLEQLGATADLPDALRNLAEALVAEARLPEALAAALRAVGLAREGAARVYLAQAAKVATDLVIQVWNDAGMDPAVRERARVGAAELTSCLDEPELAEHSRELRNRLAPLLVAPR